MKPFWLLCFLLAWPCAAAAAEPPFTPLTGVPDYVASFVVKQGWGSPRRDSRTVLHHNGWFRIGEVIDQRFRPTTYIGPGPVSVSFEGERSEPSRWLTIQRGPEIFRGTGWRYEPFKTTGRDTVLGESCDIWNVARTSIDGPQNIKRELKKLSCIAQDGIELWHRFANEDGEGSSVETTSIQRKPVSAGDVRPPASLLDLKSWSSMTEATGARPAGTPRDTVVLMKTERLAQSGQPVLRRTVRRHHPWTYTEDMDGEGKRHLSIENQTERLTIVFESNAAGEYTLLQMRRQSANTDEFSPKPIGRTETIAGEGCAWFDMTPGMADAGLTQCRTSDGVVLKEQRSSRGRPFDPLVASVLRRTPVELADVLPPPGILTRSNWGIPD